ncbi:cupin domain-containing protein [Shewanella sp. GXUN23E]|uniref:cupin domain-containing protein n=1 Tax=Shewanella sp. GXUN23E TaxID=3422498 RepID=UPI003D7EE04E
MNKQQQATAAQSWIELNADFSAAVILSAPALKYAPTPMPGVRRMMFERVGDEVARRATSCVTYQAGSHFSPHTHPGGEEYLVLSGTFSDQRGDFSAGWYVRNPPGSSHAPFTREGCEIFVKLSQIPDDETDFLQLDTRAANWQSLSDAEEELLLWQSGNELTCLHRVQAGFCRQYRESDVLELFVIDGAIDFNGQLLAEHSWLRMPPHSRITLKAHGAAQFYLKIGRGAVRY